MAEKKLTFNEENFKRLMAENTALKEALVSMGKKPEDATKKKKGEKEEEGSSSEISMVMEFLYEMFKNSSEYASYREEKLEELEKEEEDKKLRRALGFPE